MAICKAGDIILDGLYSLCCNGGAQVSQISLSMSHMLMCPLPKYTLAMREGFALQMLAHASDNDLLYQHYVPVTALFAIMQVMLGEVPGDWTGPAIEVAIPAFDPRPYLLTLVYSWCLPTKPGQGTIRRWQP
jgi:hypothetical protein